MKNRYRRSYHTWLSRWEPPATFPARRYPATDGKPYPWPPKIRTPQPDLWKLPPVKRRIRRRCG